MTVSRSNSLAAILLLAITASAQANPAADVIGQIKTESGSVRLVRGGTERAAVLGDHVLQSDIIQTGADGTVGITFADNSMMSLGPSSRLSLDRFHFNTTTHIGVFDSSLDKGTLAVKSGDIVRQTPEAMHVRTPAALLGVRGTDFVVRAGNGS